MSSPEVTIDLQSRTITEWGMDIGNPRDQPPPPAMMFCAIDLPQALTNEMVWPDGNTMTVTPDGFATVTIRGRSYVYELFPARFNDDRPYEPLLYAGRWPD